MIEKYGIDNLKILLSFLFLGLDQVFTIDANRDGKVSIGEAFSTVTTLSFKFPDLYATFPFLKKEWKDLSEPEQAELVKLVNEELDLPMDFDRIELALKLSINAIAYNFRYIKNMQALFPKESPSVLSVARS